MPLLQALRACLLHESVTVQNLHYHVKRAQLKAGMCLSGSSSKEGMVIDTCHATSTASSTDGQTSPLTETSSLSLSDSTSKRTRKTSKQVSEARIRAKRESEDYSRRFKKAFKEATRVVQGRKVGGPSNETVQQVINRLNAEYNLNGKRKLSRTTVYREINKGNVGMSPPKKGPRTKSPMYYWMLRPLILRYAKLEVVGN